MISHIIDVAVVVSNAQRAAAWYRETLGLEVAGEPGEHWIVAFPRGKEDCTHLHLCAGLYPLEPGNSGIALATPDLRDAHREMRERGVEFTVEPTEEDWGIYAMFRDPDGNEFWLYEE